MRNSFLKSGTGKTGGIKQQILGFCIKDYYSVPEISKQIGVSIPTVAKAVSELIEAGFLEEVGKSDTNGGRRPVIYGLNPAAGYFIGADVSKHHISIAVSNFKGSILEYREKIPFELKNTEESITELCDLLKKFVEIFELDEEKVLAYGINLTGRVNNSTGYSFSYFLGEEKPLAAMMEEKLNTSVFIENDSRAMTYGEYICGGVENVKNFLFINVSWGLGMGMIIDGKLVYGKSGFSGEIGHFPLLDNGIICQCGKVGCLETGASGGAFHRIFMEKLKEGKPSVLSAKFASGEKITFDDMVEALGEEDILAIEAMEEVGTTLGRAIAGLINIFNPELVIVGGKLSVAEEYLIYPIHTAVNKHSLNIVSRDTVIRFSRLGQKAGAYGACMLSRSHLLNLL